MTEYELLSLQAQRAGNVFAIYLTIISAYLVTAYIAGDKLTRPQVFIATTTYLFGAAVVVATLGVIMGGMEMVRLNIAGTWVEYGRPELAQRHDLSDMALMSLSWWIVMVIGILAPLYFMWSVRHPKKE
jgi:hypothetical protein